MAARGSREKIERGRESVIKKDIGARTALLLHNHLMLTLKKWLNGLC